jgi:prepilin-type N-terminal cleavage/methylation domain-containing protein
VTRKIKFVKKAGQSRFWHGGIRERKWPTKGSKGTDNPVIVHNLVAIHRDFMYDAKVHSLMDASTMFRSPLRIGECTPHGGHFLKNRAFTLIELLVVIAIIAILAAILFPVFAQAKAAAKKAAAISNVKQLGTSSQLYLADYDDTYGIGVPRYVNAGLNEWAWDRFIPRTSIIPAGSNPAAKDAAGTHFDNAVYPYMKNESIFTDPVGTPRSPLPAGAFAASGITTIPANATPITYTYNGLLQAYSATAIANPASLIVYWPGQGKRSLQGAAYASPQLICSNLNADCRYVPMSNNTCVAGNGGTSFYTTNASNLGRDLYSRQNVYVYADSHAKARRIGVYENNKLQDPRTDPFAYYLGQEVDRNRPGGARFWDIGYCHGYLFRPDFDFQTWDTPLVAP